MEVEDRRKESAFAKAKKNSFFKKLKKVKNIEFIACVFILAIALLLYSTLNKAQTKSSTQVEVNTQISTEIETRLAQILTQIDGAGEVSVMITYSDEVAGGSDGKITGVVVVASGANDIGVRLDLLQAVGTALDIDPKCVNVFSKK